MKKSEEICLYAKKIKKRNCKRNFLKITFITLLVLFLVINFFSKIINPILFSYSEIEGKKLMSVACNQAISEASIVNNYYDLVTVEYDSNNTISMVRANTEMINKISNILAQTTQEIIKKNCEIGLKIPIGTLSGIGFFSGKGFKINFNISPIGSVICHFYTTFTSAGINQTNHKIFVNIESNCSIILPFKTCVVNTKADYLLTECVIVGSVPTTYLNIG